MTSEGEARDEDSCLANERVQLLFENWGASVTWRIEDKNVRNRALCGKSMKLGYMYSAITDSTCRGRGSHLKMATLHDLESIMETRV